MKEVHRWLRKWLKEGLRAELEGEEVIKLFAETKENLANGLIQLTYVASSTILACCSRQVLPCRSHPLSEVVCGATVRSVAICQWHDYSKKGLQQTDVTYGVTWQKVRRGVCVDVREVLNATEKVWGEVGDWSVKSGKEANLEQEWHYGRWWRWRCGFFAMRKCYKIKSRKKRGSAHDSISENPWKASSLCFIIFSTLSSLRRLFLPLLSESRRKKKMIAGRSGISWK